MFSFIMGAPDIDVNFNALETVPGKAILLLKSNEPEKIKQAEQILNHLLDLQITSIASEHYGLWLQEEEYSVKKSKVFDKNMTTYIDIPLFILLKEYSDNLPESLIKRIEYALSIACIYILNRNISMHGSHIVIAEGFLVTACGEQFNNSEFTNYSINLFQNFIQYNHVHGSFTEYNSPGYDTRSLAILHLVKRYIKNDHFLQLSEQISNSLWKIIAHQYHYNTDNISGPAHRTASIFVSESIKNFFTDACTRTRIKTNELTFNNICPDKYRPYFDGRKQNWYSQKMVSHGSSYPYYLYPIVATTMMTTNYCIGTFNRGQCWKEMSSFLGYFGTRTSPFAFRVTTIHDNHEYSSAQLSMIQNMNYVLGHTSFATNRGDKHLTHDATNGIICAKDLRIRFYIVGDVSKLKITQTKSTVDITYDNTKIKFTYSYAKFDNYKPKIELTCDNELRFDLILYNGEIKKINFNEIKKAIVSWMFCISDSDIPDFTIKNELKKNYLITKAFAEESTDLVLESYYKPDTHENIHVNNKQFIRGILLEKNALKNMDMIQQYSYIINNNSSYTFNPILSDDENIDALIHGLKESDEESIIQAVKEILSLIYKNNVTITIVKRFAIQIISQVFEFYKNTNPRFETVTHDASQIYPFRIFSAHDTETVAYHIFELLHSMHSDYITFNKTETDENIINKITELIDNEYNNPNLSLEYIAEQCGEPVYKISRIFKKFYNLKYIDYLTNIRVNHAKNYIKNSEYTLEEISSKIGYLSVASFIRVFKKKTGMTPKEYRMLLL